MSTSLQLASTPATLVPSLDSAPAAAPAVDAPGQIEVRGVDFIPDDERHGKPQELFWVWLACNVTYLYVILGGTMVWLGLTLWQSLAVVIAGNLFWLVVGFLAITGPASGTPSVVVTRSMYGVRGNRMLSASVGWVIAVAYEAINLAVGALAGFALAEQFGLSATLPLKIAVLGLIGVVTFTISVYGHATIVRLSPIFTVVLTACVALLAVFVCAHADFGYTPVEPLHGPDLFTSLTIGFAIIASNPLSWGAGADYSRYLPQATSKLKVAAYTAAGGMLPAVLLAVVGVLAGTAIDMTDSQNTMAAIVPGWFYPIFLFVIVLGSITNNVMTAYSSGLSLQAFGVKATRARTVLIDAALGGAIAAYALFAADFLDTLSSIVEFTVTFLGPSLAIYATDIVLRRNRYDGAALNDETASSPFWYRSGFNVAGVAAMLTATPLAVLCVNTTLWTGPIATALSGSDVSAIVGPIVAVGVYLAVWPYRHPRAGTVYLPSAAVPLQK